MDKTGVENYQPDQPGKHWRPIVENPLSPADLPAAIQHALRGAVNTTLQDREGRPAVLTEGTPVAALF